MNHRLHEPSGQKNKRSVTADYNAVGVRPSSGAASTGCSDASDSIGARSRSDIAAPEDAGALRRGDPPPSLTQYRAAAHPRGGPDLVLRPVWLAKAGFGQINVALDVTQYFVIDDA